LDTSTEHDLFSVIAQFYDYVVPYRERRDVGFFVELAQQACGAVLEIGCGTGRVLIPMAQVASEVVGLDASPAMLAVCHGKLARESADVQAKVKLVEADMRNFELYRTFRLITLPFRPFQHLITVEDQRACLQAIHRHLTEDGKLVLDLFNPSLPGLLGDERFLEELNREPAFSMPDGRKVLRRHHVLSCDLFNQTQDVEQSYRVTYADGHEERFVQHFKLRHFFRFEVEHLLARSGFEVEQVYSDFDKSPYGSKYPGDLIFVARKG
jgi:SAM-dependent methyltransferase